MVKHPTLVENSLPNMAAGATFRGPHEGAIAGPGSG
jgi:hypothetical protein